MKTKILVDFQICISVPLRNGDKDFMEINLRRVSWFFRQQKFTQKLILLKKYP